MLKKHLQVNENGDVLRGLSWDNHHVEQVMKSTEEEGASFMEQSGRRVAAIPYVIIAKWRNEGFDAHKEDVKDVIKKAKEEGFYVAKGI